MPEGALIMFLHDWADVPVMFVRSFTETNYNTITVSSAILMLATWAHTRLYVFPQIIYTFSNYTCFNQIKSYRSYYYLIELGALQILHIYWFYVIVKALTKYIRKGKIDDPQNEKLVKKY